MRRDTLARDKRQDKARQDRRQETGQVKLHEVEKRKETRDIHEARQETRQQTRHETRHVK